MSKQSLFMRCVHKFPLVIVTGTSLLSLCYITVAILMFFSIAFLDGEIKDSTLVIRLRVFVSLLALFTLSSISGVVGGVVAIRKFLRSEAVDDKTDSFQLKMWLKVLYCSICTLWSAIVAGVLIFFAGLYFDLSLAFMNRPVVL